MEKIKKSRKIRSSVLVRTRDGIEELKLNRSKAIKLRCLDCCGFNRKGVQECDNIKCKFYDMRLSGKFTGEKSVYKRTSAIKKYCSECVCNQKDLVKNCMDSNCSLYSFR